MARRWRSLPLVLSVLVGAVLLPAHPLPAQRRAPRAGRGTEPDIILILTDDQRWDSLRAMPNVQSELIAPGIDFTNAFVVNSLCCPSRTSILTGTYSHSTQVYDNSGPYGGFNAFHGDRSTIATWLQGAGYRTGLVGKYLNEYNVSYIPHGWDQWYAFKGYDGSYYNYFLNENGSFVFHGAAETDYSTDVLATDGDAFIRSTPTDQPLFLYFAPHAPHAPAVPAAKYADAFGGLRPARPPNFDEADVSDKPAWVQALPRLTKQDKRGIDHARKDAFRTLLSVDDAVDTIVSALADTGRLSKALIVFASDNGLAYGEHRWDRKRGAYEEQIRVPMVVRDDALIGTPRDDAHLVANIDLAPTFADAAGVDAPGVEGLSMLPLLTSPDAPWRDDFLVEHLQGVVEVDDPIPSFCGVRTDRYLYVTYQTAEEELYDLQADPYQLENLAGQPEWGSTIATLRTRLQTLCQPPPPGFVFPYDALPPSQPTGLTGTAPGPHEVDLSWLPSTDNVAVTGYTVYRGGVLVGTAGGSTLTYVDTTVAANTTYTYTVDAFDGAGNHSTLSAPFTITTPPEPASPP
jgi:arylsulfatase A-like enzyme